MYDSVTFKTSFTGEIWLSRKIDGEKVVFTNESGYNSGYTFTATIAGDKIYPDGGLMIYRKQ